MTAACELRNAGYRVQVLVVALTVLDGRNGMPPFGLPPEQAQVIRTVHLSNAQIADVVNYMRTHFGNPHGGKVTAAQVAALPHPGRSGAR